MKYILLMIASAALFSCGNEVKEDDTAIPPPKDTLISVGNPPAAEGAALDSILVRHALVNAPFHNTDEMAYFRKIMPKRTERKVELKPNIHDGTVTDTLTTLHWGKSYLETISNATMERSLLNYVIMNDNNIVLKNNIRIGQDLKTVCEALHLNYDSTRKYKFIELATPEEEAESYLTFYFKDNVLQSIVYSPYTG
jgi:hypothetical protein